MLHDWHVKALKVPVFTKSGKKMVLKSAKILWVINKFVVTKNVPKQIKSTQRFFSKKTAFQLRY